MNIPWPHWLRKKHACNPSEAEPNAADAEKVNRIAAELQIKAQSLADAGKKIFEEHRAKLEAEYPGQYVMINVDNHDYVVAKTITEVHKSYKRAFPKTPGWCTRIGASVFAHAS